MLILTTLVMLASADVPPAPLPAVGTLTAADEAPLSVALETSAKNAENARVMAAAGSIGIGLGIAAYDITAFTLNAAVKPAGDQASQETAQLNLFVGTMFGLLIATNGVAGLFFESPNEARFESYEAAPHETDEQRFRRAADALNGVQFTDRSFEDNRLIVPITMIGLGVLSLGTSGLVLAADAYSGTAAGDTDPSLANIGFLFGAMGGYLVGYGGGSIAYYHSPDHALLDAVAKVPALKTALDVP